MSDEAKGAVGVLVESTTVETRDGAMEVRRARPSSGEGPWPAVIFCMDGAGLRPSLEAMVRRIADMGYVVFAPDLFHRSGSLMALLPPGSEPSALFTRFADPEFRKMWWERFFNVTTDSKNVRTDMEAVFALIDADPDVRRGAKVGCTGYCMGGHISLKLAGLFGERVGACGSFHGGFLATESPDSPHRFVSGMKGRLYVGAATDDLSFTDEMKERLVGALKDAGVEYTLEVYPARHGWCVADSPSFDAASAERHYAALQGVLASLR